jgi:sporulation protein YlmC with PRC-barrel domain
LSARTPRRRLRLEDLLGSPVRTEQGEVVGRIEEVRAERRGDEYEVTEYHLGPPALLERLGLGSRVFGRRTPTVIAQWDQLDVHNPKAPVLTCPIDDLKHERR